MSTNRLDKTEARQILEEIARSGPDYARISAIRCLLELNRLDPPQSTDFDALDELAKRRRQNTR